MNKALLAALAAGLQEAAKYCKNSKLCWIVSALAVATGAGYAAYSGFSF